MHVVVFVMLLVIDMLVYGDMLVHGGGVLLLAWTNLANFFLLIGLTVLTPIDNIGLLNRHIFSALLVVG